MTLTCIAIDDEPLALQLMKQYAAKTPQLRLLHLFDEVTSAQKFLKETPVDLLFTDINMPDVSGTELVRTLPHKPLVIFTTAYKNFAYEGFELEAVDYLLKPFSFTRFEKAVTKAVDYYQHKNKDGTDEGAYIFVRSEYRMIKINTADINYIEGLEDYIKIHLQGERPVLTLMTMKSILEKLPADRFKRIHRSYIINTSKVKLVTGKKIVLFNSTELPVSDSYLQFIRQWISGQ